MSVLALLGESELFFNSTQRNMLDGLLGEDKVSDQALQLWAGTVNFDDIDAASYRLVPALYARAGMNPALQSLQGRMKGIYRYYFYRNNRFLAYLKEVFSALLSAGIEFLVFKGISVLVQYHQSAAGRSSADCDILVHPQDKARAEVVLASFGLVYCYDAERKPLDQHSHDFADRAGNGVDLHWHALLESCEVGIDDAFWHRSKKISWNGLLLRVLAAEDERLVAGINGVRDIENARADWLYDASLILKATPKFDWRLLHRELTHRQLPGRFLTAIGLLQRFLPHFPESIVKKKFHREIRTAVTELVAENRVFALDTKTDRELTAALKPSSRFRRFSGAIFGPDWRARAAQSSNVVRYIRYDQHQDGSVARIYLHRDFLASLDKLFEIADPALLQTEANLSRRRDQVEFSLAPGEIRVPLQISPPQYFATVKTDSSVLRFSAKNISSVPIEVCVTNSSTGPWYVFSGSENRFGLSYHLFTDGETILCWDFPRSYFLAARPNQMAILRAGDSLQLKLEILRPPSPGRYEARLDVVQERVQWLDPDGKTFPRLLIEVS